MNYIQILYLCILKQRVDNAIVGWIGCELHSNLVSLHSETTVGKRKITWVWLWITFKSCIFAFWNNHNGSEPIRTTVVNYIQILYLCILKQQDRLFSLPLPCCELHSNLVSLHSETTSSINRTSNDRLWITFKSCIFAFWNNRNKYGKNIRWLWITFKSCIFAFWNNEKV